MNVDFSLQPYFNNAQLLHRTGEQVWIDALRHLARLNKGPASKAAQKFFKKVTEG